MKLVPDLRERLAAMSPEDRKMAEEALAELDRVQEANPLALFSPHPKQRTFFEASTPVVAAFAGNRFGKTTALTVRSLLECLDEDWLPGTIKPYKRWVKDKNAPRGTFGRIVNPSFKLLSSVILPSFRQWAPPGALRGGSFDKAYKGAPEYKLYFANGSWIEFMTHEQDLDKFGGSALHFVGYDEPPSKEIRDECNMRLSDWNGYEMFACTPLKVNVGWMRRDIYRQRESPDNTVIQGSIHDNPNLSAEGKRKALESGDARLRPAREFGLFVDVGGLIYPEFERCVVDPPEAEDVRRLDVVVGIDPGIRNAGFSFIGFDNENVALMFDEGLLQDQTPSDYAGFIRHKLKRWGIEESEVTFVIDPAARARSQVNAETIESALGREGIYCVHGQNDVEAGIAQMLLRMQHKRWKVSRECTWIRDEADDYAAEERDDGKLVPQKGRDHCFVAGTMIATERGERPIESIRADDMVWTRAGLRRVAAAGQTAIAETCELSLPNGRVLRGTPNHPIWTENRGWVDLDSVRYADTLLTWEKQSSSEGSATGVTPTPTSAPTGCTSEPRKDAGIYTARSGSTITDRSPMAGTSITATGILSTTTLGTLSASPSSSTSLSIGLRSVLSGVARTLIAFVRSLRRGTPPRKDASGIVSMVWRSGRSWPARLSASASNAASPSSPRPFSGPVFASALTTASPLGGVTLGSTMLTASAPRAEVRSGSTSTPGRSTARVSAAGKHAVFNLTVEGDPEYFANGVLVHNCLDAARYVCMHQPFDYIAENEAPGMRLGWEPDFAPSMSGFRRPVEAPPMGSMA